jgi:hypothetical protein
MQLNPKHLTLHGLFQGRLFRIPDYQRAYAWVSKQRNDLFDDILEVHKSGQDHFMATVVCLQRDKRRIVADEYQTVDVVDGQQRLTTLIIMMKAIEKALDIQEDSEKRIKRETAELLVKGDDHSLILLQTNHDSSSVFVDYLRKGKIHMSDPKTAADKNLMDAENECEAFVEKWKTTASLVDLVAILRNRLSLIYHELTDEAAVYRVFEVLNSRGLDVKWIDKLKSQLMAPIFTHADSSGRTEALNEMRVIWEDIYRTFGLHGDLGDEALRFAGTMRSDTRPNRLLTEEDATSTLRRISGLQLKSIVQTANWLNAVVGAVDRLNQDNRLRAVTRIVHARFVAAAILLRGFSPAIEKRLLGHWDKVTFRVFGLGGADTRHKVGEYIRLGYDIIEEKPDDKEIYRALTHLGEGYSINAVLNEMIDWTQCYEGWTEEIRYLLFRYDEFLAREAGERLNEGQWNKIWAQDPSKSIEHITPQSSEFEYIHHLGNLTMLPPGVNSSLRDKPPLTKAATYQECGIKGTAAVGNTVKKKRGWNKTSVLERAKTIEKFVREEWA